jgi:hypothetical protein
MTGPTEPPAVDPRLLAGLSSRPAPPAVPRPSEPAGAAGPGGVVGDPGPAGSAGVGTAADPGEEAHGTADTAGPSTGVTGHPGVDAALGELARAERLPPDQQISAYESVHRTLQETLRTIEQS